MPADLRLAAASLFALCAPNLFAIQNYSIVDVGVLIGSPGAGVSDINNSGTIVGYTNPAGTLRGYRYDGTLQILPPLSPYNKSSADVINSTGNVAGATIDFDFKPRGVRYVSGAPVDLNVGNIRSDVFGINDSDIIAGSFQNFTGDRAFRWKNGTTIDLGTLGGTNAKSFAINNSGAITGFAETSNHNNHAFVWRDLNNNDQSDAGEMVQLADYGLSSAGNTINAGGSVGGFALLPSFHREPTLWIAGVPTPLPIPPGSTDAEVFDLNVFGIAVGNASTGAVLWDENHNVFNLQSLISGPIPFTSLVRSAAINDAGLIIGIGRTAGGEEHGFLMTPVPEPGVASAAIALAGFSRRRIKSLM